MVPKRWPRLSRALSAGINYATAVLRVFAAGLVPEIGTKSAADRVTGSPRRC